jgi:hypothetical protein
VPRPRTAAAAKATTMATALRKGSGCAGSGWGKMGTVVPQQPDLARPGATGTTWDQQRSPRLFSSLQAHVSNHRLESRPPLNSKPSGWRRGARYQPRWAAGVGVHKGAQH